MPNYIPYDPSQSKTVVINYTDQLHPGTFEHAIHFLIEHKLDLSVFDPINKTCTCPAEIFFEERLTRCRACELKHRCMHNPDSANDRKGHGRQVSFIISKGQRVPIYTDWMKHRIDYYKGKLIYSHLISVVGRFLLLHFRPPWRSASVGNIGSNKRLNRFRLRGKKKVQGLWQLYCLIHNIEKLKNYGELAT